MMLHNPVLNCYLFLRFDLLIVCDFLSGTETDWVFIWVCVVCLGPLTLSVIVNSCVLPAFVCEKEEFGYGFRAATESLSVINSAVLFILVDLCKS